MITEKASENDVFILEHLERLCFSSPISKDMLLRMIKADDSVILTAKEGPEGNILGYGGFQYVLDEGYIFNIAVFEEHRRKHAGKCIMEGLEEKARALGLSFLTLEVRQSNLPAIGLYSSMGYTEAGRRKGYYTLPKEDAVIMTKTF